MTLLVCGWLLFGVAVIAVLPAVVVWTRQSLTRLSGTLDEPDNWPRVSVIIPARDESARIESAVRSMLACDYPDLELIAVDDRSTDSTGDVLDAIAAEDSRLKVIHIQSLPDNWLGKSNAMQQAADSASGEVLLFTDGDIVFGPDSIRLAVRLLLGRQIDHLCLLPRMVTGGWFESAVVALFGWAYTVGLQTWLVPRRWQFSYAGVGAFNMVRSSAYRAVGGHEPIRLDVLDDVKLGKLLKRSGYRSTLLNAVDCLAVRWQPSFHGVITGLEKNGFASVNYSFTALTLLTLVWLATMIAPYVIVCARPDASSLGFLATLCVYHFSYGLLSVRCGGGAAVTPLFPVAGAVLFYAYWRSAWITWRQAGVKWRDTFYPLALLRDNIYR